MDTNFNVRKEADNMLIEACAYCENVSAVDWDVDELGYSFHCLHCGKPNMFCDECLQRCLDAGYSESDHLCDTNADSSSCWRKRGEKEPPVPKNKSVVEGKDINYVMFKGRLTNINFY